MKKSTLTSTAYHEAGHVLAFLLVNKRFNYVTIIPDKNSLGLVRGRKSQFNPEIPSIMNPDQFPVFFQRNFIDGAGYVAERIYNGKNNFNGSFYDFLNISRTSLSDLPESFNKKYIDFLAEYTFQVFQLDYNWLRIQQIAKALIEQKKLTYKQVLEVCNYAIINY